MQRSDDINGAASNGAMRAINFAGIMVQGSARMLEIQAAAARTFCQYPVSGEKRRDVGSARLVGAV